MENVIQEYTDMIKIVSFLVIGIVVVALIITIILSIKKAKNKKKCPKCNASIDKDSVYCKWCGAKV